MIGAASDARTDRLEIAKGADVQLGALSFVLAHPWFEEQPNRDFALRCK